MNEAQNFTPSLQLTKLTLDLMKSVMTRGSLTWLNRLDRLPGEPEVSPDPDPNVVLRKAREGFVVRFSDLLMALAVGVVARGRCEFYLADKHGLDPLFEYAVLARFGIDFSTDTREWSRMLSSELQDWIKSFGKACRLSNSIMIMDVNGNIRSISQ